MYIFMSSLVAKLKNFIYAQLCDKPFIFLTVLKIVAKKLVSKFLKVLKRVTSVRYFFRCYRYNRPMINYYLLQIQILQIEIFHLPFILYYLLHSYNQQKIYKQFIQTLRHSLMSYPSISLLANNDIYFYSTYKVQNNIA